MNDIDPKLVRLREIEARIALIEIQLIDVEKVIDRLRARALSAPTIDDRRDLLLQTRAILVNQRTVLLSSLETTGAPAVDLPDSTQDSA